MFVKVSMLIPHEQVIEVPEAKLAHKRALTLIKQNDATLLQIEEVQKNGNPVDCPSLSDAQMC